MGFGFWVRGCPPLTHTCPQSPCCVNGLWTRGSCSTQPWVRLSGQPLRGPLSSTGPSLSWDSHKAPLIPPFSTPSPFSALEAPCFLYSALCLSLWNPISGLILLCLGSVPPLCPPFSFTFPLSGPLSSLDRSPEMVVCQKVCGQSYKCRFESHFHSRGI